VSIKLIVDEIRTLHPDSLSMAIFQQLSAMVWTARLRTEPVLWKVNCAVSSESRNRLADVALLMNSFSALISLAGFE